MFGIASQIQHYYIRREGMGGDTGRGGVDIVREGRRSGCNNTPKGGRSVLLHPSAGKSAVECNAV